MNCSQAVWEVIQVEAACHGRLFGEDIDTDFLPGEAGRQFLGQVYFLQPELLAGKDDLSCGHSGSPGQLQVRYAAERIADKSIAENHDLVGLVKVQMGGIHGVGAPLFVLQVADVSVN